MRPIEKRMPISFDRLAAIFDDQRGLPPAGLSALQLAFSKVFADGARTLIEPGAGTGRIAIPALAAGLDVTAVDLSQPMLDEFQQRLSRLSELGDHCELVVADATALPFDTNSFDVGVLAQVLYLIPEWKRALDELVRVVKPGGNVMLIQERTTMSPELARWDAAWRGITEQAGHRPILQEPDDHRAVEALAERTVDVAETRLASWEFGQTAQDRIAGLDRVRPLYQSLNQTLWIQVLGRFREWFAASGIEAGAWVGGEVALTLVRGTVADTQQ